SVRPGATNTDVTYEELQDTTWEVPYLPIDPKDIGRDYEAVIRVNSQSGKGGVAYIMKTDHGIKMPRAMQPEFSNVVQAITDAEGGEVNSKHMWDIFNQEYLERTTPLEVTAFDIDNADAEDEDATVDATVIFNGKESQISGTGNGTIAAYANALGMIGVDVEVLDYSHHERCTRVDAEHACFHGADVHRRKMWGFGIARSTTRASLRAVTSAVNRALNYTRPSLNAPRIPGALFAGY